MGGDTETPKRIGAFKLEDFTVHIDRKKERNRIRRQRIWFMF